jgi:hypothetical protein
MTFHWKRLWREINVYFYFFSTFLLAFVITYIVLVTFYYDHFVYNTSDVQYLYDNPEYPSVCTGMRAIVPDTPENNADAPEKTTVTFDTCIFTIPLTVYYFDHRYSLEKEEYDDFVNKSSTFLQLILYIYTIFICSFAFVIASKTCLFCCKTRIEDNQDLYQSRRRALFFQRSPSSSRIVPLSSSSSSSTTTLASSTTTLATVESDSSLFTMENAGIVLNSANVELDRHLEERSVILSSFLITDNDRNQESTACPICLDNFNFGDKIVSHKTCQVLYHTSCVKSYFSSLSRQNNSLIRFKCPTCRGDFF